MSRRLGGCVALLLLLASVLIAASTVRMVVQDAVPVPILDQWAQLVGSRSVTLSWLVSQHNEHRLLFPRLVFLADRWLAAETGRVSLAVSLVMQAGAVALLVWLARGTERLGWRGVALNGAVVVTLLSWAVQYENQTWPFQVQFFGVLLAAAGCFAAVAAVRGVTLAIGLGVVAAFTLSNGVAMPVLATGLAAWVRRPARDVVALGVAAAVILGLYLVGYQTPPDHDNPVLAAMQPVALLAYAAAWLGGPFASAAGMVTGRLDPWLAETLGACGIVLLVGLGLGRRSDIRPQAAALVTLCLFVLATAVLTAAGRASFGVSSALASRYATPALVFWACLWLLGRPVLARLPGLAEALAPCVLLLVGWTQPLFAGLSHSLAANRAIAIPALVAGVADTTLLAPIYPDPAVPLRLRLTEFDTRTGPFSQRWAPWIGSKLHAHVITTDPSRCRGSFDTAVRVADTAYPGWRVLGSLVEPVFAGRRWIVALVDASDQIVGFGISDANATALAAAGPAGDLPQTGWVGAIAGAEPGQVRAYVLLDQDRAACPLQNRQRVESPVQLSLDGPLPMASAAGSVDAVDLQQQVTLDGWAMVQTGSGTPRIHVDTNLPVQSATIVSVARPDAAAAYQDARLAEAGFRIVLVLGPQPAPPNPRLCLWSEDAVFGLHRLVINPALGALRDLCPQ